MKKNRITQMMFTALGLFLLPFAYAGQPLWTFTPLTPTTISISPTGTAIVSYTVTNQSRRTRTLAMRAIPGITQVTGTGHCSSPFTLAYHQSCTLQLHVDGSALAGNVVGGPDVCQANSDGSPNPNQCYQPSPASGNGTGGGVLNIIKIPVATAFSVGGSVSGLVSTGLVLRQNDSGDVLPIGTNGAFTFPTLVTTGAPYDVFVETQPAGEVCTVTNGHGIMDNANVTNIIVTCAVGVQTVGGTINGLTGGGPLGLLLNEANLLTRTTDGNFTFATAFPSGSPYAVTIQNQPPGQLCTVNNGSGTITDENVTNVAVQCAAVVNSHTIGGTISGLSGSVILQNNGGDNYTTSANGSFTFATSLAQGSTYNVSVVSQPVGQICTVSGTTGTGTVGSSNVTSVVIVCSASAFTVGGSNVSGLIGTVELQLNGGALLPVSSPAVSYVFPEAIAQGASYIVHIVQQPVGQTCTLANSSGVMGGANVTDVNISCVTNTAMLSASVSELALSITGLTEYGIPQVGFNFPSGFSRMITITNTGSVAATNLVLPTPTPAFPTGTGIDMAETTCNNGISLAPGGSCVITIKPGNTASSDGSAPCGNQTLPKATAVEVKADNSNMVSIDVVVLNYGCQHQNGLVYAFDDTTPITGSVGGKVATLAALPPPPHWADYTAIYGIANNSSPSAPYPTGNFVTGQKACKGAFDGACNTHNIFLYYQPLGVSLNSYAAGLCKELTDPKNDWYLPAICELAGDSNIGSICTGTTVQNMVNHIAGMSGYYWSSTEESSNAQHNVWYTVVFTVVNQTDKANGPMQVRCSRIF